jgi:outer membrane beta-barrel protein
MTMPDRQKILATGLLFSLLLSSAGTAAAAEAEPTGQVIQPEIDRRELHIPRIDTEDYEIGLYGGILSVEDLGAEPVYGARLAYHVSEDFFVEGALGKSTVTDQPLCDLGLCLFPEREQDLTYFALSVGFNLFPGEVFLGRQNAMTSTVYVLAGVGSTSFVDENRFTLNFGIGIRMLPVDWLALHVTMRDYLFESDILGTNKITNNFELTVGVSVYF